MGYTGYFYEAENDGSPNEDPTILGVPAGTPLESGLHTEYYDVYTDREIDFAIYCPNRDGDFHYDDCDKLFEEKVLATGEPYRIMVKTGLVG